MKLKQLVTLLFFGILYGFPRTLDSYIVLFNATDAIITSSEIVINSHGNTIYKPLGKIQPKRTSSISLHENAESFFLTLKYKDSQAAQVISIEKDTITKHLKPLSALEITAQNNITHTVTFFDTIPDSFVFSKQSRLHFNSVDSAWKETSLIRKTYHLSLNNSAILYNNDDLPLIIEQHDSNGCSKSFPIEPKQHIFYNNQGPIIISECNPLPHKHAYDHTHFDIPDTTWEIPHEIVNEAKYMSIRLYRNASDTTCRIITTINGDSSEQPQTNPDFNFKFEVESICNLQ